MPDYKDPPRCGCADRGEQCDNDSIPGYDYCAEHLVFDDQYGDWDAADDYNDEPFYYAEERLDNDEY